MATTVACSSGTAPELSGLEDQIAQVGTELKIDLAGTDVDGDQLSYSYRIADLEDDSAQITQSPSGAGVFRWTPLASDVGEHAVDFTVSDGDFNTTVTINIDVRSAIGSATAPVFRQPLGTGTQMDLVTMKCLDLDVIVEDQDSAMVTLQLEEPFPEGMALDQEDGLTAKVRWCPTREQESENRYTIVISADDGDNPKIIKNYLIVLRGGATQNCPGAAPVITHTPSNEMTIVDLTVDATVSDDKGLKEAPLFYYSTTNPGATPNLGPGGMTQTTMVKIQGNVYAADVPNPVANMPAGQSRTLYYVIVADDDDDETGNCDHTTQSVVYSMVVTSTGSANLGICAPCTSDTQCGAGDLCAYVGSMGDSYCLQACGTGCPTGYACSAGEIYSVDGAEALQCVPSNGSCVAPTAACVDDANEDDDTQSQASANAAVDGPFDGTVSNYGEYATLCPKVPQPQYGSKADDDWRQLRITADTLIDMYLVGNGESDIDLQIYNSSGALVSKSTTLGYEEQIVKCLKPATYYVKVNGFDNARTEYTLDWISTPQTCNTTCTDDSREDDNTYTQARTTTANYTSTGNKICPDNEDWYKVTATANKKIVMNLTFTQSNPQQDLDFGLVDENGFTDLWPCSYDNPTMCTSARGQGGVSNERAEYTMPATCPSGGCTRYVLVRGYNHSSNDYDISIQVQ
ncbi:MAG: Ig-like domain-containing protein [Kofleriaceae bacterium]